MSDAYPYASQRANARRWLARIHALAFLGSDYLLAVPVKRIQQKPKQRLLPGSIST